MLSKKAWPAGWLPCMATLGAVVFLALAAGPAGAQVAPAATYSPPDDTPSIKVGATLFADYTYQRKPTSADTAGNDFSPSSFNVTRAYLNITGNVSHIVSFRVTPDITRMSSSGSGVSTTLDGSLTFRLKYAYLQVNLDDWLPKGTWVRLGMQQTPFIDSIEGIYRYRFQGPAFPEREGYMPSADLGVTLRAAFPNDYGDVHVGVYNGEGYARAEVNGQKAFEARVAVRPLPGHPLFKGWRIQGFVTRDNYMQGAPRDRYILDTTFEHRYANVGVDYLKTKDKASSALTAGLDRNPTLDGKGLSVWATPKRPFPNGSSLEALVRYDRMEPGGAASATAITSPGALNQRTIAGIAYWFPKQGNASAALLFDYEQVRFSNWSPARPTQQRLFLHSLIAF